MKLINKEQITPDSEEVSNYHKFMENANIEGKSTSQLTNDSICRMFQSENINVLQGDEYTAGYIIIDLGKPVIRSRKNMELNNHYLIIDALQGILLVYTTFHIQDDFLRNWFINEEGLFLSPQMNIIKRYSNHPHISSDGNPCWGEYGTNIKGALFSMDLRAIVAVYQSFLKNWTRGDSFYNMPVYYDEWKLLQEQGCILGKVSFNDYIIGKAIVNRINETGISISSLINQEISYELEKANVHPSNVLPALCLTLETTTLLKTDTDGLYSKLEKVTNRVCRKVIYPFSRANSLFESLNVNSFNEIRDYKRKVINVPDINDFEYMVKNIRDVIKRKDTLGSNGIQEIFMNVATNLHSDESYNIKSISKGRGIVTKHFFEYMFHHLVVSDTTKITQVDGSSNFWALQAVLKYCAKNLEDFRLEKEFYNTELIKTIEDLFQGMLEWRPEKKEEAIYSFIHLLIDAYEYLNEIDDDYFYRIIATNVLSKRITNLTEIKEKIDEKLIELCT